ncbi:MAG: hypothetical protein COS76_00650 [Candidatus Portnoybacteria bacterium CG06_land_8_20_14_3_00_39_12]|uniref:Amidohydrolase-related domain-containing protein n=3 Tax=Candidatus Portnoyibacteriota TaxID=1817913 RepID=A0A2M7UJC0_9BACT|nr:MAG: hypothetical protein AUJ33_02260 [Parcubacteria group bacterium CG1_02_40_25]PIU75468.1 MAG: hypothetical protein COS76_00650 [Candidatus Portnoybacteria bacterium CG06_land_8_20_14_3_00_39_12]PIZ71317.1 MAG: hypothetical protein COY09_00925 [Candidatus Portnoybacteria bacterium CG_4_10_14_0_2_um_filter_39_11]
MRLNYPVIDLHTHLRNNITGHTKFAKQSGIDIVVYMANCQPPLDNLNIIKKSLAIKRHCRAFPVSAITKDLADQVLVDIDQIRPYVVGFSDDGKYLEDLDLLEVVLEKDVLILAHCSPDYEISVKNPERETENIEKYLRVFSKIKKGRLHFQHISQGASVALIRKAKKQGLKITCETCPHYFTFTKYDLDVKVNPPLATEKDVSAIRQGLADDTVDVIASDYAPEPRLTGIAGFRSFLPLCYGLVLDGTLSAKQLKEKLYINPRKIIKWDLVVYKL